MSGEDFFKFNSGKEFRFSNFREIKEEDLKGADAKIKKFFNIFAGDDKILQATEAQSLFEALKSAAGDNKTLETDEIKMFTKEKLGEEIDTNIFTNFVNNVFGGNKEVQAQAASLTSEQQTFLEDAACKGIVIDIIDENLSEAFDILNSQYLGSISGWHDERKDKNDILKTSNVAKVLDYQNAGVEWMNKAKLAPPNGLTKKEYYEGNKQRIKDMILTRILVLDTNSKFAELKQKYSEEELGKIIGDYVEQLCSNATMEDLKNIQKNFVSYSGVEEIQALENVVDNAIKFNEDKNKPMPAGELAGIKLEAQKGMIPEYWNSDEPITFEEVYEIERGVEYSQYKIEQYALAKKEMEIVANAYNKKQQFVEFSEALRKDETLSADEKAQKVLEGFADFYALSEDGGLSQLKELISKSKLPIAVDENGFNFGTLDDNARNRALNSLLKLAKQEKETEFEKFLNGKTIEDYQKALAEAQNEAIGEENGKLMAEAMKNDNLTCIQRWTGNTSMVGMGMTVVGGILCFTPLAPLGAGMITAGNTLAIGGMVAETGLGVADYATKDVQTAEEAEQLTKNFLMNAGGFIIGMGAGKAGMKAFNKLIDEKLVVVFGKQIAAGNKMQALKTVFTNPEYLKNFMTAAGAKLSADFVISYAGDLAMMGVLDTDDNWQSLLKANLTGILVGMSGDIKDVSGVGRPRNFGVSDGVKPMTEFDYGQRLLGNDVTIVDPKTGVSVDGTVTGLHTKDGQVEIEVSGQRYSTNDVSEVRGANKGENSDSANTHIPDKGNSNQSSLLSDIQYTKKSIKQLIQTNPDLKNNEWVQNNISKLLDVCSESIYGGFNDNILKRATKVALEKIQRPLLTQHRLKILNTFLSNPSLYENKALQQDIHKIICYTDNASDAEKIAKSLEHYANYKNKNSQLDLFAPDIIRNTNLSLENKQKLYDLFAKGEINYIDPEVSQYVTDKEFDLVMEIHKNFSPETANLFISNREGEDKVKARIEMYELIKNDDEISNYNKRKILARITEQNVDFAKKYYKNPEIEDEFIEILQCVRKHNQDFAETMINDKNFPNEYIYSILLGTNNNASVAFAKDLYNNPEVPKELIANIVYQYNPYKEEFARILIADPDFPKQEIANLLKKYSDSTQSLITTLYNDKSIPREDISKIVDYPKRETLDAINEVYNKLKTDKDFPDESISKILMAINKDNPELNKDYALELCKNYKNMEIPVDKLGFLIENYGKISPRDLRKLNHAMGRDNVNKLSDSDLLIACQMVDIYGKTSINEIPMEGKQNLLRRLVACNDGLFKVSDEMKKAFPLIPTDKDTYCSLLPAIVKSLGVDIRTIEPPSRIKEFNDNMASLSTSLAKLSDTDFASLEIKLDYSKDKFITDVLDIVKDLSPKERQKVYDYFGFELHHNKNNQTGFSIYGYPINLNNGKKLAEITDPNTKEVVEKLRPYVVKFSEQNPIKCNNTEVEKLLNDIIDVLPELRTEIGKTQHKTHEYDVFQHSLKVMQKVAQDPKFQTLNESDKKIMMLASLLHDITKGEGYSDKTHASQGSFDTFFIGKKFNLTREEEIKLYTLTRHHEWLGYVNTAKSEDDLTKRLQSVAYDLRHDNLFDMALMFTHADLRAVKKDNSFHDTKVGRSRVDFNGKVRSFGNSADFYADRIKGYIGELQTSQPILPVTKIPKTDRINEAITKVNPDGSTNIKGVYKRSDGLVVIKFNEVEDWEAIGFPKGSVSRGYEAKGGSRVCGTEFTEDVNTGNIKFFVHGLDYENQLAKFDAFSLIDSDALLSVSYAERPESKLRFFRSQGVLLDIDTKYIHGGGETDAGSGCKKFIEEFKNNYIFGGGRESDRLYISKLVKEATGMSDSEYIQFVKDNENKPLSEIEPKEYQEILIKAYASINSNTRKGGRAYNEMYASNPNEVMADFTYNTEKSPIGNPLEFLARPEVNKRTAFLQQHAKEHHIPFIVFGD